MRAFAISAGFCAALSLAVSAACPGLARDHRRDPPATILIPGSQQVFELDSPSRLLDQGLVEALIRWISANSDLPPAAAPRISLTTTEAILRAKEGAAADRQGTGSGGFADGGALLSLYEDSSGTIYLRDDWSPRNYRELSLLVHELTHHLQNVAGRAYGCPAEREKLAYRLQETWLNLYRRSLASEFNKDPFKLLLETSCLF